MIILEIISQNSKIEDPSSPLAIRRYLLSLPINIFIIWGAIIPIKPIIPTYDTVTAHIIDAKNKEIKRSKGTLMPKDLAILSLEYNALYLLTLIIKKEKEIIIIINTNKSSLKLALDKSPKEKWTLDASKVSLAKNCNIVVIELVKLEIAIPLIATTAGEKFLTLLKNRINKVLTVAKTRAKKLVLIGDAL